MRTNINAAMLLMILELITSTHNIAVAKDA